MIHDDFKEPMGLFKGWFPSCGASLAHCHVSKPLAASRGSDFPSSARARAKTRLLGAIGYKGKFQHKQKAQENRPH